MRLSKVVFAFCLILGSTALKVRDDNQQKEATDAEETDATGAVDSSCTWNGVAQDSKPVYDNKGMEGDYSLDAEGKLCDTACGRFDGDCHDNDPTHDGFDHTCYYMCIRFHQEDVKALHKATSDANERVALQAVMDKNAEIVDNFVVDHNDVHKAQERAAFEAAYEANAPSDDSD